MRFVMIFAVGCLLVGIASPVWAQQNHGPGHEGHAGMEGMQHKGMRGMGGASGRSEPGGAVSTWTELESVRDAIGRLVDTGKLADVHGRAERLEPLSRALLDGARALPEAKRARIEATLRQLPGIGSALDKAGDAGDVAATQRELRRLRGAIALIEAQDPDGVLRKATAPSGGPASQQGAIDSGTSHHHDPTGHSTRPLAAVDEAPKTTLRVKASDFKFAPAVFSMKAGEPTLIQFVNDGAAEHDLVVKTPDGKSDWIHLHAKVNAVVAATFRMDEKGSYRVFCTVPGHKEAGMVGQLVVQ